MSQALQGLMLELDDENLLLTSNRSQFNERDQYSYNLVNIVM